MKLILCKKDLLPKAITCIYLELIVNEENFVLVDDTHLNYFLAIHQCIPSNYLQVLGYFDDDNKSVIFLFNLFQIIQKAFFVVKDERSLNINDPLILEIIPINSLIRRRMLNKDDYIYCFKEKCLYKTRFSNFIKYFSSFTKCKDLTKNQILLFQSNNKIEFFNKKIIQIQNEIKQKSIFLSALLKQIQK